MKCEYCDTVYSDAVTGTCPNCGAVLPERKASSAKTVGASRDEERRRDLQASGCKYCPYCLSTDVAKPKSSLFILIVLFVLSCVWTAAAPWLIVLPIFLFLTIVMAWPSLKCGNCKLLWTPSEAKIYEKYRLHLYPALGRYSAVHCSGINRQTVFLKLDRVRIRRGSKEQIINYDHLGQVYHKPPEGNALGYLTVRSMADQNKPIPQTYEEAQDDRWTIVYEAEYEPQYGIIYQCLQGIAEMNANSTH